jgi:hypothetical protein
VATDWHDIGVGIAQGYATLGTIGFEVRFDDAAIGTVIDVASRLYDDGRSKPWNFWASIFQGTLDRGAPLTRPQTFGSAASNALATKTRKLLNCDPCKTLKAQDHRSGGSRTFWLQNNSPRLRLTRPFRFHRDMSQRVDG